MCQGQQNGSGEREREREVKVESACTHKRHTTATPKIYCGDLFALSITYFCPLHKLFFPPSLSLCVSLACSQLIYLFIF